MNHTLDLGSIEENVEPREGNRGREYGENIKTDRSDFYNSLISPRMQDGEENYSLHEKIA
jgi:hypothetical protein